MENNTPPLAPVSGSKVGLPAQAGMIVLAIGMLLVGLAAGYYFGNSSNDVAYQTPTVTVTVSPIASSTPDVATWKTYENDAFGFEFQYPDNFVVVPVKTNGRVLGTSLEIYDQKYRLNDTRALEWPMLTMSDVDYQTPGPFAKSFIQGSDPNEIRIQYELDGRFFNTSCVYYSAPTFIQTCNQILSTFRFTK